jgi:hypothetical protein
MEYFRKLDGCKSMKRRAGDGDRTRDVQGIWASIESKESIARLVVYYQHQNRCNFTFRIRVQPNGPQLGCTITMQTRSLDKALQVCES